MCFTSQRLTLVILTILKTRLYLSGQQDTSKARHHQDVETSFKESSESSSSKQLHLNKQVQYSVLLGHCVSCLRVLHRTLRGTDLSASSCAGSQL